MCCLKTEPEAPGSLAKVDHKWSVWHRYSDFEELDKCVGNCGPVQ